MNKNGKLQKELGKKIKLGLQKNSKFCKSDRLLLVACSALIALYNEVQQICFHTIFLIVLLFFAFLYFKNTSILLKD